MNQNFFAQLIVRLGKANPQFFKIIQFGAVGLGTLSVAFAYINTAQTTLPCWLAWIGHHEVWITSFVAAVMAQLPNATANDTSDQVKKP